jgi:hypothetical protein
MVQNIRVLLIASNLFQSFQDLIVLFSDTLIRAMRQEMVTQDMVDECDPSLMFAIPRLAIVYGLLICPKGPLNVDRSNSDFPDLFLPFKNLLRKIRELLQTLNASEVMVLEMLLCQQEEPANISTKLKEVDRMLETKEKTEEGKAQARKLQVCFLIIFYYFLENCAFSANLFFLHKKKFRFDWFYLKILNFAGVNIFFF